MSSFFLGVQEEPVLVHESAIFPHLTQPLWRQEPVWFTCHPNFQPSAEKAQWRCCGGRCDERGWPLQRPSPCVLISQRVGPHTPRLQHHLHLLLLVRSLVPEVTRAACVGSKRQRSKVGRAASVSGKEQPLSLEERTQVWAGSTGLWLQLQWQEGGGSEVQGPCGPFNEILPQIKFKGKYINKKEGWGCSLVSAHLPQIRTALFSPSVPQKL